MKVKNRSAHRVGYTILNGPRRVFNAGETLEISIEEIGQLMYQPGGRVLIEKYLLIPEEGRQALNWEQDIQPEYDYTEEDITNIMLKGSLDEFLDMIDFAPEGVITLIRKLAITLPLNDMNKMEAFKNKFGYDIASAIKHQKEVEKELKGENFNEEPVVRQRRVQPSKYKVIQ
jgi:hypothetical protein